jgi:thiol-disulfide isomerase/thioredoxin
MAPIVEIKNSDDSDNFINGNSRAVIFFGSSSCGHCRSMKPIYDDLARSYPNIAFAHVETNNVKTNDLEGVPAFVAYYNREPVDQVLGARENALRAMIQQL